MHCFSHHLPVFTIIPLKNEISELPKFINITKTTPQNWENLTNDLNAVCWNDIFITDNPFSNPTTNYSNFIDKVLQCLQVLHFIGKLS